MATIESFLVPSSCFKPIQDKERLFFNYNLCQIFSRVNWFFINSGEAGSLKKIGRNWNRTHDLFTMSRLSYLPDHHHGPHWASSIFFQWQKSSKRFSWNALYILIRHLDTRDSLFVRIQSVKLAQTISSHSGPRHNNQCWRFTRTREHRHTHSHSHSLNLY